LYIIKVHSLCGLEDAMRVRFVTLGCKVNQYETQALKGLFSQEGFSVAASGEADVLVVNSCTVTSQADRKTRQTLRRLRREHPGAVIALTGCLPQTSPDAAASLAEADIVTGTADRARLPALVRDFLARRQRAVCIAPTGSSFEPLSAHRFDDSFQRAYLKVEDGCDRLCSYCVIPLARGPVRSRPPGDITREVGALVSNGYREIVLTGINLSRYGADLGLSLPDAVAAADAVGGAFRIRLGSVEPDLLTESDWRALSGIRRLCPHFHLPLQSGCDGTLRRMNRRYDTADYLRCVERIRGLFDNPSVSTDLIVGFPGETDAEFDETRRFVRRLGLLRAHVFEFSPRRNTPAATLPLPVEPAVKKQRAALLSGLCRTSGEAFAQTQVGRRARVLLEATGGGYTDNYLYVHLAHPGAPVGSLLTVRLTGATGDACVGNPV
jgi:threonylcarbamoyladenosine tRNA methylthiotransferase MtaB